MTFLYCRKHKAGKSQEQGYKGPPTEVVAVSFLYCRKHKGYGGAKKKAIKIHQQEVVAANSHQCRHRVCNIRNKTKIRWVVIKDCVTLGEKNHTVESKQAVTVVCVYGTKIVVLKYV